MEESLLLSILFSSLALCQIVTIYRIPLSEYVIASEGEEISLYCLTINNVHQAQTSWFIRKVGESLRSTSYNGSTGELTEPSDFIGQFTATGDLLQGTLTFQTNFTLLNFTREFDLTQITCGTGNAGESFIYTIGLPVTPSLMTNDSVQAVEDGDVSVDLQGRPPNAFPPTITSSQLSLNDNPVSNTGVTVNDYTASFTNVQRNQSGIYTLTVSNDAGTSNTTFTLDVQCMYI
ncbi:PREDICTED: uncharacterized protein LOC109592746 [Amphimedon queenslandica]|uniref:Immunoglobulin domain-containing protein n=1 Tax=Amphimedon queenslandica TaxID=400682 RepID=A0AAN0K319_AMPQE|nr:PREDICTED: uncharacterized protein LOC109592746 [Amphimedon queenslandica]|eukprot:XP_019863684.1 PREDICTED: uncharacterized protein LOC109592746 [Amphimedon queenslandica]